MSSVNTPQERESELVQNEAVASTEADTNSMVAGNVNQVNARALEQIEPEAENETDNPEKVEESPAGVTSKTRSRFRDFFKRKKQEAELVSEVATEEEDVPKTFFGRTRKKFRDFFANMAERVGPTLDPRLNELKEKSFLTAIEERELTIRQRLATIRPLALAFAIAPIGVPTFGLKPLLTGLAYGAYHGLSIASIKAMRTRAAISESFSKIIKRDSVEQPLAA